MGADFQEKMLAISRDRRFNCDGHCDNGASLVTSFSPKSIQSGVGIDVSCSDDFLVLCPHPHSKGHPIL